MCDDFDPACLPENFVSISRPSSVIQRLIEKRKTLHEEAIECMRNSIREINQEVEEMIKCESLILQQKLQDSRDTATKYLEQCGVIEDMDIEALRKKENAFLDIASNIEATNRTQISTIESFYEFLIKTEKYRIDKIKDLMKQTLQKLQDIGYKLPYENEEFFGNEILGLNKLTLNNMQAYEDLKKELRIRAAHNMKRWCEEILEAKELLKKCFRKLIKTSVTRFAGSLRSAISGNSDLSREISRIQSLQSKMQVAERSDISVPITERDVEDWLKRIRTTLAALDKGAKNIVSLYKNMIVILFNRFFTELDDFRMVIKRYKIMDESEIQEFESEIYTPTVDELDIRLKKDLENLQTVWGRAIEKMKETIDVTYGFLKGAACLWDKHFRRIREAQFLVLQDVENMVEVNNLSIGENEAKLNILLDKLRQGPSEKKLNKLVQEVYRILDGIKDAYGVHCNTEIQVVQKYRAMVEFEIEVLLAEITRLLTVYPPDEDRDPKKQRGRGSQIETHKMDPDEALLPMQMLYCIFQVDAVEFSIYQKRKRELDEHNETLNCHKKAAEARIKKLKQNMAENIAKYTHICDTFRDTSQNFLDNTYKATFSSAIRMACTTLDSTLEKFKSALTEELDHILQEADDFWDELRVSGLFREGGNYSTEEVLVLQKSLKKLEATARKQLDVLINNAKTGIKPYTAQLEKRHAEIILTVSEVIKEYEHNENVERMMNRTQQQIKDEMYNLKMKQREINISLKKLVNEFEVNVGKHDQMQSLTIDKAQHSGDFLKCLYEEEPPEENNFISKLNRILYRSFSEVQQYSKEFYHKHHRFHREKSVMHHSLDEFMAEVLNKYKGFLVQCEVCWIDSCKEYLDALQKFRNYRQMYLKTFESVFYKNCEEDFQKTVDEVTRELKEEKKHVEQGNKEMFDKLKALYGHPKNEILLKELEEQYKVLFVEYDAKYSRISNLYKEKLYEKMKIVKQRFEETVFKIETARSEDQLSDMIDSLLESYNLKLSTVHGFRDEVTHLNSYNGESVSRFSKTIMKYLTKFDGVVARKRDLAPSMVTSEGSIVPTPEIVLKNMEANEELQLENISQFVEKDLLEYIRNYDKIWSNEITCIKNLFTVKYDRRNLF
nr:unnamed protein product [Callosobruchus chinensis]